MQTQQATIQIERKPLHREVAERLRGLIVDGHIPAGERLNERLLCEQLGISRTPLREALKLLETEGLVALSPNRGAQVAPLDSKRLAEALQVMGALEALAGDIACQRATDEWIAGIRTLQQQMIRKYEEGDRQAYFSLNQEIHLRIVEACGNATLSQLYRQLNANVLRARYMANLSQERWAEAVEEHKDILLALERRDSHALRALLHDHLANKLASIARSS